MYQSSHVYTLPPKLTDRPIEQVSSAKLLGVYFTDQLSMTEHLNKTVAVCNQRLYLLCQLKKQGIIIIIIVLFRMKQHNIIIQMNIKYVSKLFEQCLILLLFVRYCMLLLLGLVMSTMTM